MATYHDPKKNTWYAKFSFKDRQGNVKFTTKRGFLSEAAAAEYEREFKLYTLGDPNMKFEYFVNLYLESYASEVSAGTAANRAQIIKTMILPKFAHYRLSEIKPKHIAAWYKGLTEYRNMSTGNPYSHSYIRSIYALFSSMMDYAVNEYGLFENPFRTVVNNVPEDTASCISAQNNRLMLCPKYSLAKTGLELKKARLNSGLSIKQVVNYLCLSTTQPVHNWENGKAFPRADQLMQLASLYSVQAEQLIVPE